jgi:hypothetical protein
MPKQARITYAIVTPVIPITAITHLWDMCPAAKKKFIRQSVATMSKRFFLIKSYRDFEKNNYYVLDKTIACVGYTIL